MFADQTAKWCRVSRCSWIGSVERWLTGLVCRQPPAVQHCWRILSQLSPDTVARMVARPRGGTPSDTG